MAPTGAEGRLRTADEGTIVQPSTQPMPTLARHPYSPSAVPSVGSSGVGSCCQYPDGDGQNTRRRKVHRISTRATELATGGDA